MNILIILIVTLHLFINVMILYCLFCYGSIDKRKGLDKVRAIILTLLIGWIVLFSRDDYLD